MSSSVMSPTLMILSPGWSPCCAAGLPGWTAVTKMPTSLPPVSRMPTLPSFWKLMKRGSGREAPLFVLEDGTEASSDLRGLEP